MWDKAVSDDFQVLLALVIVAHPAAIHLKQPMGRERNTAPVPASSIRCMCCRERSVHCFDSQSGKCQNCARRNETCIFELKFSSNRAAAIPVSAFPGGVPPGTQLFGAYGQPLAPGTVPASSPPHPAHQHSTAPPPLTNYYAPVHAVNKNPSRRSPAEFSSHSSQVEWVALCMAQLPATFPLRTCIIMMRCDVSRKEPCFSIVVSK
ncbi:hypothetical protein IWW34DRAFT_638098 [Fusarium oxysporum f. sp. albedinis]|nr:hypothetical protein IWW34DRAFT_638098 [Fusarium oxysporum f. sp. albedinis]